MSEFGRMYKNALTWGVLAAGLLFRGALAAMDALYRGGSFWQRAAGFWDGTGSVALAALVLLALIHVFSADRETGVEELALATPFGRGRLFARRIAAAALAAATGALILAAGNLALSALLSSEPVPEGWLSGYARTSLTAVLGAALYAVFAGCICDALRAHAAAVCLAGAPVALAYFVNTAGVDLSAAMRLVQGGAFAPLMRGRAPEGNAALWAAWYALLLTAVLAWALKSRKGRKAL